MAETPPSAAGGVADAPRGVRPGVRLGVDVGSVRVGLAASDPDGLVATAVKTLARDRPRRDGDGDRRRAVAGDVRAEGDPGADVAPADLVALAREVRERAAVEVVVGLPRSLSGQEGRSAGAARQYAGRLADLVAPVPVRLVDERLSTAGAHRALHDGGTAGRRHRAVVDQVAAAWILQTALDLERSSGRPPGSPVRPLGPDGRRRRGPAGGSPSARGGPQQGPEEQDQHDEKDQHGHQDDEVGSRRGAGRADEDAVRAEGPPPEEDATVSTTRQPAPRPGPRGVVGSPATRSVPGPPAGGPA
ncbi:Holliday junction resolvase RuvX [Pseudokineococcus sp. 5B2Z-1]|uniref:Holliday junction resolvase RuvX n=1 Tax=Pseudokineococcus sp. 5B2Z-1 TaxID=3132744 RepID=UPI003099E8C0